jgi:hypothetical protein
MIKAPYLEVQHKISGKTVDIQSQISYFIGAKRLS